MRNRRVFALFPFIALLGCGGDPPCRSVDGTPAADPLEVPLADAWSGLVALRDVTTVSARVPRPEGGYYAAPLHAHLLPNGKVLLHGEEKVAPVAVDVMFNDASFILDPAHPSLRSAGDVDLPVEVRFPVARSVMEPDGLEWRVDPRKNETFEIIECGGHTFLADGRLFYAGGGARRPDDVPGKPPVPDPFGHVYTGLEKAAIYNFAGEVIATSPPGWSTAPPMGLGPRWYPTVTRLADGTLLVASGYYDTEELPNPSIERFDPARRSWTAYVHAPPAGDPLPPGDARAHLVPHAEDYTHGYLLPVPIPKGTPAKNPFLREVAYLGQDGQVTFFSLAAPAEADALFVPPGGRRPARGAIMEHRVHGSAGVLLPDGRILVAGGTEDAEVARRVDVYDPRPDSPGFDTWSGFDMCDAEGTCVPRHHGTAVLLPDGRALVLAGHSKKTWPDKGDPRRPAYLDWRTGRTRFGSPSPDARVRGYHNVALLLPDGRVLVAGGRNYECDEMGITDDCYDERPDLRVYEPDYLTPALAPLRPRIEGDPQGEGGRALERDSGVPIVRYGKSIRLAVGADRPIDPRRLRAVLVGLGSVTHSFDQNLRHIALAAADSTSACAFDVRVPESRSAAPPGPYLLFVLRAVRTKDGEIDLPSVGRIVYVR